MDEKHEADKIDDVMLPGFRFHPTDEELVAFYLRRKILQQSLPIELIRQVDIYKFDPWDLPSKFHTKLTLHLKRCYDQVIYKTYYKYWSIALSNVMYLL